MMHMMTDRARELYRQASEQAHKNACEKNKTNRPQNNTVWNEFVPLYTELIVQECFSVLTDEMDRLDKMHGREVNAQTMDTARFLIKNHFGVE